MKLSPKFVNPCEILVWASSKAYCLKLAPPSTIYQETYPLVVQLLEEPRVLNDVYKVDLIVAERKHKYWVCCLGYNASEYTWLSKKEL